MSNQISDKLDKILKLNGTLQRQAAELLACNAQLLAKLESLQANIDLLKSEGVCSTSEVLKVLRLLLVRKYSWQKYITNYFNKLMYKCIK